MQTMYRRTRNSTSTATQQAQLLPNSHTHQYHNADSLIYRTSEDIKNLNISNSAEKMNYRGHKMNSHHGSQQIIGIQSNLLNKTMHDSNKGGIVRATGRSLGGQRGVNVHSDLMLPYSSNATQMVRDSSHEMYPQNLKIQMMKRPDSKRFSAIQVAQPDNNNKPSAKKVIQRRAKM